MVVYVDHAKHGHERDLMQALAGSLHRLGHDITQQPCGKIDAAVVWNGRDWPRGRMPTLYCEAGWLPRWWYQISHGGINADSHLAPLAVPDGLAEQQRSELETHLEYCRTANPYDWPYLRRCAEPLPASLPERFILVPLQIEADTNMRHVAECRRTAQGLVDWAVETAIVAQTSLPLVFKVHPALHDDLHLDRLRPGDVQMPAAPWTVHDLLASGRCAGVYTANSNTIHDALLWGVEWGHALDAGIWGDGCLWGLNAKEYVCRYLFALKRAQWDRARARNPSAVRAALEAAVAAFVPETPRIEVRTLPTVNVCLGNRGWLFNDLAQHLARLAPTADCTVAVTEAPLPDAAAYLYMRADEARQSTHPERTVCQVHDQWGNWHNRYNGCHVAGWSLTHPDQDAMLRQFVDLRGCRRMLQPLGAPDAWQPREAYDRDGFAVAWVGRAVAFKRAEWFTAACAAVWRRIHGFRAVLLGANLKPYRDQLAAAGVPVDLREKDAVGYEHYHDQYCGFGAVVICSAPPAPEGGVGGEAHPLPLFEAMACGVPVISTPVGWAPWIAPYIYTTPNGLQDAILEAAANRERDFEQRKVFAQRAARIGSLERWCVRNLKFALETANGTQQPHA